MTLTTLILHDHDGAELVREPLGLSSLPASAEFAVPLSFSVLIAPNRLAAPCPARLELPSREVPVQAEALTLWPDGSVQWLRLDVAQVSVTEFPADLRIRLVPDLCDGVNDQLVRLSEGDGLIHLDTGVARFELDPNSAPLLADVSIAGGALLRRGAAMQFSVKDYSGTPLKVEASAFHIEAAGPVRATLRSESLVGDGALKLTSRASFFAGTGMVKLEITLHNPRAARHPGGVWDLGDPGSFRCQDFSLELSVNSAAGNEIHWFVDGNDPPSGRAAREFTLHQESSGGENWNSPNHVNAAGIVPVGFRGYRLSVDGVTSNGNRATPTIVLHTSDGQIGLHVPEFWEQFPKVLAIKDGGIRIGLFPAEFGDTFELQGGERKTHVLWLHFAPASAEKYEVAAALQRSASRLPVMRPLRQCTELPPNVVALGMAEHARLDTLVDEALSTGPRGILANREAADEYGWRHFGEIVADHEQAYYSGPEPLISHYNNQFDFVYGLLLNYLRTGNEQLFELGDALARHVVDIDIYHTLEDRSAYSGGMFWHTDHYRNAFTATHRAYSLRNKPAGADYGGGPSCEHNYTTGLYLHYCLTGARASRDAVVSLADWVLRMDDGGLTPWRFFDSSPTGWASATREENFHGPGRGAGNSINALLDAWSLTGSAHYLEYAERLIRRCIHPQDDIASLELLDFEARWSYTVFLTALLKYLDLKASADTYDRMFHYGRASLRHYARWMTDNEVPYFDRPGQMEFPTETWAAQELRKANVLRLAAAWVDEPWKSRMFETGGRLAERAWQDLQRFETRSCARPLAILMVEALKERDAAPPTRTVPNAPPPGGFGPPTAFVTQKQRVKAMLRSPRAALKGLAHLLNYPFRRSGSAAS